MGTSYSHFREALRKGHAREASDLYYSKRSLKDSVLPNHPLGCDEEDNTALHYAAKFGLQEMYVDLINRGGKPDQKNKRGKNCLHLICGQPGKQRTFMLRFTLEAGLYGMDLAHVLEEKDEVREGRKGEGGAKHSTGGVAGWKYCLSVYTGWKYSPARGSKLRLARVCGGEQS